MYLLTKGDVAVMPRRQESLVKILSTVSVTNGRKLSYPKFDDTVNSTYHQEILKVYRSLGGVLEEYPLNLRGWDLSVDDVAVELDEQLHFNRCRAVTLKSKLYRELPCFPLEEYSRYCLNYEYECLRSGRHGRRWTSDAAERQFGKPSEPGVLDDGNAPRWKQRAFYDFVKDLTPLLIHVPVTRIAIWDSVDVGGVMLSVSEVLDKMIYSAAPALLDLIEKRSFEPK